jgi:hypothetical protein
MMRAISSTINLDKLAFIYIELPQFNKVIDQLTTREDKWLFLFRHLPELTQRPQPIDEPIFGELFEVAEIANFSPEEQDVYQSNLKAYRDFNNVMNTAIQEAEVKGIEKGMERGAERERSLIIRLLIQQVGPLPVDLLAQVQQLTLDELEVLADTLLNFSCPEDLTRWLHNQRSA